jgi:3-phenylpropionate/trans-cinnamate dioxygenase ferredoxin subunit
VSLAERHWFRIAAAAEVPAECLKEFFVGGLRIIVANHEGRFYALQANCPHLGGPLREGKLVRSTTNQEVWIDCPWHHYLFELSTGENYYPKSVYPDDLKTTAPSIRVFPIRQVHGGLEVEVVYGIRE